MTDAMAGSATPCLPGKRRRPLGMRGLLSKALFGSVQIAVIAGAFLGGSAVTPVIAANASANLDQCANDAGAVTEHGWLLGERLGLGERQPRPEQGIVFRGRLGPLSPRHATTSIWRPTRSRSPGTRHRAASTPSTT